MTNKINQDLVSYYKDRANEYDQVYQNPDEQDDLSAARTLFQRIFSNKSILEIACGTGYWTEHISKTASSLLATDINQSVIEIAKTRPFKNNVTFEVADMYSLNPGKKFDGMFGGFILSHIPTQEIDRFLGRVKEYLVINGDIVFMDSNPTDGTNHDKKRITKTDHYGNTYQTRNLGNGTIHEVLKNFPTQEFLVEKLSGIATEISYTHLRHYLDYTG